MAKSKKEKSTHKASSPAKTKECAKEQSTVAGSPRIDDTLKILII